MTRTFEMSPFESDRPVDPVKPKSDGGFTEGVPEPELPEPELPEPELPETTNETDPEKPKTDGFTAYAAN